MGQRKREMDLVIDLFGQANKIRFDLAVYQVNNAIKESIQANNQVNNAINTLKDELKIQQAQINGSIEVLQVEKVNLDFYRQKLKVEVLIINKELKDKMQNAWIRVFCQVALEIAKTLVLIAIRTPHSQRISTGSLFTAFTNHAKDMVQFIELIEEITSLTLELIEFNNLYASAVKRVDLMNETEAEELTQDTEISNDFMRTLQNIVALQSHLKDYTTLKSTGKVFCDVIREKTDIDTMNLTIAINQIADGGHRFTVQVFSLLITKYYLLKSVNSNFTLAVHSPKFGQAKTHFLSHPNVY